MLQESEVAAKPSMAVVRSGGHFQARDNFRFCRHVIEDLGARISGSRKGRKGPQSPQRFSTDTRGPVSLNPCGLCGPLRPLREPNPLLQVYLQRHRTNRPLHGQMILLFLKSGSFSAYFVPGANICTVPVETFVHLFTMK